MASLEVVIRYEGDEADEGHLDLYDAGESLRGIARAVNLITHAFANNNQVRDKIPKPKNVQTFIGAARKGCFKKVIGIEFSETVIAKVGNTVINKHFWEYLEAALDAATGHDFQTENSYVSKIINGDDSPFEELARHLENPLQMVLRPIKNKGAKFVSFVRPHVGDIVKMDAATYEYVSTLEKDDTFTQWIGNVTKYNILTGYGRAYIDDLGQTVPFNINEFESNQMAHVAATASMGERAKKQQGGGKRKFVGHKVINAAERIKRLVITEINQQE